MNEQLDRMEIKLAELQGKIDGLQESFAIAKRYFVWGFWITVALIALPLLVLPLFLPAFLASVVL